MISVQVNDQISRLGGDTASVILVVTDGVISDLSAAQAQVYTMYSCTRSADPNTNNDYRQILLVTEALPCLPLAW